MGSTNEGIFKDIMISEVEISITGDKTISTDISIFLRFDVDHNSTMSKDIEGILFKVVEPILDVIEKEYQCQYYKKAIVYIQNVGWGLYTRFMGIDEILRFALDYKLRLIYDSVNISVYNLLENDIDFDMLKNLDLEHIDSMDIDCKLDKQYYNCVMNIIRDICDKLVGYTALVQLST